MSYDIIISPDAEKDFVILAKSEPKVFQKVQNLIHELREHPTTGTGHPEPLKGQLEGRWSRRITKNTDLFTKYLRQKF